MKLYRVHLWSGGDGSGGYSFHASRKDAAKAMRAWQEETGGKADFQAIQAIEVNLTKPGILYALNIFASHPDNG
jgi:hypothetical protein